jgi:hypothetical protein
LEKVDEHEKTISFEFLAAVDESANRPFAIFKKPSPGMNEILAPVIIFLSSRFEVQDCMRALPASYSVQATCL